MFYIQDFLMAKLIWWMKKTSLTYTANCIASSEYSIWSIVESSFNIPSHQHFLTMIKFLLTILMAAMEKPRCLRIEKSIELRRWNGSEPWFWFECKHWIIFFFIQSSILMSNFFQSSINVRRKRVSHIIEQVEI